MPSAFLSRKLKKGFDHLDTNGDAILEVVDFTQAGERIAIAFGQDPISAEGVRLRRAWETLWDDMIAPLDRDNDGRVKFDEFNEALGDRMAGDPSGYERIAAPCLDVIVDVADRDSDGRLTKGEFSLAYRAMFGLTDDAVDQAFSHLDVDGDGYLTRAELHQAVAEYWGGDDEQANGNWLLGPI